MLPLRQMAQTVAVATVVVVSLVPRGISTVESSWAMSWHQTGGQVMVLEKLQAEVPGGGRALGR